MAASVFDLLLLGFDFPLLIPQYKKNENLAVP